MNHSTVRDSHPERGGFCFGLIVAMAVIAAILVLAWIILLPRLITQAVSQTTGLSCHIDRLHANPFTGAFRADGLVLGNPEGWGHETMAEITRVDGKVDLFSLRSDTLIIEQLEVDIARFVVVIDGRGRTNLEALAFATPPVMALDSFPTAALAASFAPVPRDGPSRFIVQQLDLYLQRLEVLDQGAVPPRRWGDDLEYQETHLHLRHPRQLLSPQLLTRLAQSPVVFDVLLSSGILGGDDQAQGGVDLLWDRAAGALNSLLQGLEQNPNP